jgi:CheY-like chemotaxis protein
MFHSLTAAGDRPTARTGGKMMERQKILVIDDDPDAVEVMRIALEANGYDVSSASNGTEGLRAVKAIRPELIILDVMMDTTTEGFQVSYQLRSHDPNSEYREFSTIPIIMLTGISQKMQMKFSTQRDGDYLAVDEFLEKPVRIDPLLETIRKLLKGPEDDASGPG